MEFVWCKVPSGLVCTLRPAECAGRLCVYEVRCLPVSTPVSDAWRVSPVLGEEGETWLGVVEVWWCGNLRAAGLAVESAVLADIRAVCERGTGGRGRGRWHY